MPYSTLGKNAMLDWLVANKALYLSLHDGDPGDNGANEISGGSPAYARQQITTWGTAAGGVVIASGNLFFDIPAGTTVMYAGFWNQASGGEWIASDDVDQETFGGQGTYKVTDATLDLNA